MGKDKQSDENDGPLTMVQLLEMMAALARGRASQALEGADIAWLAEVLKARGFKA